MTEHVSSTTVFNQSKLDTTNHSGVVTCHSNLNTDMGSLPERSKGSELFDQDAFLILSETTTLVDEIDSNLVSCSPVQGSPDSTQFTSNPSDQGVDNQNHTNRNIKEHDGLSPVILDTKLSTRCEERHSFEMNDTHEGDDNRVNISQQTEYCESRPLDQTGHRLESTGLEYNKDSTLQTANQVKTSHKVNLTDTDSAGHVSNVEKFDLTAILSLRHGLISLVKEKSLMKERADEYELKIHDLVTNISGLEKERETLQQRLKQQKADFDSLMADTKRALDHKLGRIEMEERFANIIKSRKKEQNDLLRQETTKLQLSNYRQEQKIKELEAKLKGQENVSSQFVAQLGDLQKKLADLTNLYTTTRSWMIRLEQSDNHHSDDAVQGGDAEA